MSRDLPPSPDSSLDDMARAMTGDMPHTPLVDIARHLERIATALEKLLDRQGACEEREREGRS